VIYGHEEARTILEQHLPSVVLLRGSPSIGKRTLASHLADHHGYPAYDVRVVEKLSADEARDLKRFAGVAPMTSAGKLVIAEIDGASDSALNALLKLLEEPPPSCKFLLLASRRPLDTILSRSHQVQLGLLSEQDVYNVLHLRFGMEPSQARRAAEVSGGRLDRAMTAGDQDQSRAAVLTVLKSIADKDPALLEAAASKWDQVAHDLLARWCREARSGRWSVFDESETFGLAKDPELPLRVLRGLRLNCSPKLAVRVVVEPLTRR
jgi:replication-associated recombination protein RarA